MSLATRVLFHRRFVVLTLVFVLSLRPSNAETKAGEEEPTNNDHLGSQPVGRGNVQQLVEPPRPTPACLVRPLHSNKYDGDVHSTVIAYLHEYRLNLVEYSLHVFNSTPNPLDTNNTWNYKSQYWSRVRSTYGRTILSLAFNYKILSLLTFAVSIEEFDIEVEDIPRGCLRLQNETAKVLIVRDLMLRDMNPLGPMSVIEGEDAVCHQLIVNEGNYARFTDECCFRKRESLNVVCEVDKPNDYIASLDIIIAAVFGFTFFFGPLIMPHWIYSSAAETNQYMVKLKTPHFKTICISYGKAPEGATADHVIDLRNRRDFLTCRKIISELPSDAVIPAKVSSYNISVDYWKLVDENRVSVSLFESAFQALFMCKVINHEAVQACCNSPTGIQSCCRCCGKWPPWQNVCKIFGKILLALCLPIPYYLRVAVYYAFENGEVTDRQEAANKVGLDMFYNYRMMQFLTPIHPIYIVSYIFYLAVGFTLAFNSESITRTRFQQQVILSLADLKQISWLAALNVLAKNIVWPFKRFGVLGFFIGLVWWPIMLPITLLATCFYCVPLIFLTSRIIFHRFRDTDYEAQDDNVKRRIDKFEADYFFTLFCNRSAKNRLQDTFHFAVSPEEIIKSIFVTLLAIVALCSCMLMLAEVMTCFAEVFCFTFMGLIVNATILIKFATLIFLATVYAYDTFTGVTKQYLKLNKALFALIKDYIGKDLYEFTSLPSWLQDNRAFKSSQQDDRVDFITPDDVTDEPPSHWRVNELVLFVDNEDRPRIPRLLFDKVCDMKVPGNPGPVHLSYMRATQKFLNICLFLVFVFLVVLSFGESYKVSPANQMLAAMCGGFMPMFFRTIMRENASSVETDLVSFRGKLQEVIKGFVEVWPMYDLIFDVEEKKVETEEPDKDAEKEEGIKSKDQNKASEQGKGSGDGKVQSEEKAAGKSGKDKNSAEKQTKKPDGGKQRKIQEVCQLLATMKDQIDSMQLMPARDKHVDILILTENSDIEWIMEESFSDFDPEMYASLSSLTGNGNNQHSSRIKDFALSKVNESLAMAEVLDTKNNPDINLPITNIDVVDFAASRQPVTKDAIINMAPVTETDAAVTSLQNNAPANNDATVAAATANDNLFVTLPSSGPTAKGGTAGMVITTKTER